MRTMRMRASRAGLAAIAILAVAGACSDETTTSTPLGSPTGLAVQQLTLTSARVSWNAVSGAK